MEQNDVPPSFPSDVEPIQSVNPNRKDYMRKYKTNVVKWLAITQMTIGVLMLILGILSVLLRYSCYNLFCSIGYGIWYGVLYTSTGVVGICSVRFHPNRKLVLSYMILNIISASLSFMSFVAALGDVLMAENLHRWRPDLYLDIFVVSSMVLILTIFQIIICIVAASFSCKAVCQCCNESSEFPNYAIFDRKTRQFVFVSGTQGELKYNP